MLDARVMAQRLGLDQDGLRQTYLRYKPGVSCLAAYVTRDGRRSSAEAVEAGRWQVWSDHPLLRSPFLPDGAIPWRIGEGRVLLRAIEEESRFGGGWRLLDPARHGKALKALGFGDCAGSPCCAKSPNAASSCMSRARKAGADWSGSARPGRSNAHWRTRPSRRPHPAPRSR